MKTIKFISALILLIGISFSAIAQNKKGIETVTFKTDISCQNCVNKINKNIPFEKGVKDVQANVETKEVTVTFDTKKTDKDKLVKAFEKISVKAEEAEKNTDKQK
ncbi:MAG: heavy-metal-associated domain-containing protein [Prevotellaceae bacterium]|jgi:copper chaperone CopZ|nr:heavy-metal-associated domain-containing protein [Prevotellaceae bacterium]